MHLINSHFVASLDLISGELAHQSFILMLVENRFEIPINENPFEDTLCLFSYKLISFPMNLSESILFQTLIFASSSIFTVSVSLWRWYIVGFVCNRRSEFQLVFSISLSTTKHFKHLTEFLQFAFSLSLA